MLVRKCDICKKAIKKEQIRLCFEGDMQYETFELCLRCAGPIIKFLKSKKLISSDKKSKR